MGHRHRRSRPTTAAVLDSRRALIKIGSTMGSGTGAAALPFESVTLRVGLYQAHGVSGWIAQRREPIAKRALCRCHLLVPVRIVCIVKSFGSVCLRDLQFTPLSCVAFLRLPSHLLQDVPARSPKPGGSGCPESRNPDTGDWFLRRRLFRNNTGRETGDSETFEDD